MIKILVSALVFLLPAFSFAAVSYSRTPSGLSITSPVSFNVSADTFSDIDNTNADCAGGAGSCGAWGINAYGESNPDYFSSTCYASTTLSAIFTDNFTTGYAYTFVNALVYTDIADCEGARGSANDGVAFEGNQIDIIFSIVAAISTMFTVPTSTASDILANVTSTLGDVGFLTILAVAAAIPLVFYVARALIGLISHARSGKK